MGAEVLVVFDNPSGPEDRAGKSFEGGQARLVRKMLAEVGIPADSVRFTYLVRCRPPDKLDWRMVARCQRFLSEEVRKIQPRVIVAFGAMADGFIVRAA
jgi:DNA polymerase